MGAGFTDKQRGILCSLGVKRVITAFDRDSGGDKARLRVSDMLKGIVRVTHCLGVPHKKDPDEWSASDAYELLALPRALSAVRI
jgi:DNA primase